MPGSRLLFPAAKTSHDVPAQHPARAAGMHAPALKMEAKGPNRAKRAPMAVALVAKIICSLRGDVKFNQGRAEGTLM